MEVRGNCDSRQPDHPPKPYGLIVYLGIRCYMLLYPIIQLPDSEGPDDSACLRKLMWAFVVRNLSPKTFMRERRKRDFTVL